MVVLDSILVIWEVRQELPHPTYKDSRIILKS